MELEWRQSSTPVPRPILCDICEQEPPPGRLRCDACREVAHEAIRRANGGVVRPSDVAAVRARMGEG